MSFSNDGWVSDGWRQTVVGDSMHTVMRDVRGRLRCRSYCILRGLLLQRHHRLGHLLLLRFVHHTAAVDDVQQLITDLSGRDRRQHLGQLQGQGQCELGLKSISYSRTKYDFSSGV